MRSVIKLILEFVVINSFSFLAWLLRLFLLGLIVACTGVAWCGLYLYNKIKPHNIRDWYKER